MAVHLQNNGDFFELFLGFGTVKCLRETLCREDAVELYKRLQQELGDLPTTKMQELNNYHLESIGVDVFQLHLNDIRVRLTLQNLYSFSCLFSDVIDAAEEAKKRFIPNYQPLLNHEKIAQVLGQENKKRQLTQNTITDETMPTNEIHVIGADGKKVIIKF